MIYYASGVKDIITGPTSAGDNVRVMVRARVGVRLRVKVRLRVRVSVESNTLPPAPVSRCAGGVIGYTHGGASVSDSIHGVSIQ